MFRQADLFPAAAFGTKTSEVAGVKTFELAFGIKTLALAAAAPRVADDDPAADRVGVAGLDETGVGMSSR